MLFWNKNRSYNIRYIFIFFVLSYLFLWIKFSIFLMVQWVIFLFLRKQTGSLTFQSNCLSFSLALWLSSRPNLHLRLEAVLNDLSSFSSTFGCCSSRCKTTKKQSAKVPRAPQVCNKLARDARPVAYPRVAKALCTHALK